MSLDTITYARSRAYAIQASLILLLAVLLAVLNLNVLGQTVSFLFLPLIIIYLWPREADYFLTYCLLFFSGLALDFLSGGATGFWPLVFLLCFGTLRPDQRGPELGMIETWLNFSLWIAVVSAGFFLASILGVKRIAILPLLIMLFINILIFPALFYLRRRIRAVVIGDDG